MSTKIHKDKSAIVKYVKGIQVQENKVIRVQE